MTTLEKPPAARSSAKATVSERVRGERRLGMYLTLPSYVVMLLVTAYPLGYALVLSLYRLRLTDPRGRSFVGLDNYLVIVTDPVWWNDFATTLAITVVTVAVELVIGFGFAFVMLRIARGRGPLRTAILIPYGIVTVVSAFIWRYAFAIDAGFVNQWLHLGAFDWFGDRWSAIFVISLSEIWKTTPFISLLLLAGLVQVPEDMQEAAKVDGATAWQRLRKITLPNMKAAVMVALLFRTLDAWRIFDNPVCDDQRRQQHRDHLVPGLPPERHLGQSRYGIGGFGRAVLHRRHHCLGLRQAVQDRSVTSQG